VTYVFGFIAAVAAVYAEWLYLVSPSFWTWRIMASLVTIQPIIAYAIFRLVKASPNLIAAIVIFSFSTLLLRIFVTLVVQGKHVSAGTWVALSLLVVAQFARRL
jgi:hypothetical protein